MLGEVFLPRMKTVFSVSYSLDQINILVNHSYKNTVKAVIFIKKTLASDTDHLEL